MATTVDRELPTDEARELLALTREMADAELTPLAADYEEAGRFPRETFRTLGKAGLLGLPFPEEYGGGGQPYEVYLQVLAIVINFALVLGFVFSFGVQGRPGVWGHVLLLGFLGGFLSTVTRDLFAVLQGLRGHG